MKRQVKLVAFLVVSILLVFEKSSIAAQQLPSAEKIGNSTRQERATLPRTVPACKDLKSIAAMVVRRFDEENDAILAMIHGTDKSEPFVTSDKPDTIWDTLVDCSQETKSSSQRVEALRALALWEQIRADNFAKQYRTASAPPIKSPQCESLDGLAERVDDAAKSHQKISDDDFQAIVQRLGACAEDSERLNSNREQPEALKARRLMFIWGITLYNTLVAEYNDADAQRKAQHVAESQWREDLANPSSLVSIRADASLTGEQMDQIVAHNRALCDQIITVTRITPSGLALEQGTPDGRKFLAEKYPRMCLLEDSDRVAPGVPRYLLVYASSESDFAGFQPIQRTISSPVSGSGTLTNPYGNTWNFTFSGTLQTTQTLNSPYVLESQSLFLYAYDAKGNIVSRHSISGSRQIGGDPSYAAGYNAGSALSQIWNNPRRLADKVLEEVKKDSAKYAK